MRLIWKVTAAAAATIALIRVGTAEAMDVGALADVRQNVYGVPPAGAQAVKRKGDPVAFRETLQTLDESSALVRFIDDSKLSLGAKSKVLIDEFVFDPKSAQGKALIEISVGTLRWVTGDMPKGGTIIKTPTATLVLRGTDVVVHVHPDGTTDTTVNDGKVEAHNNSTNEVTNLEPGDGATLGEGGTTGFEHDDQPDLGTQLGHGRNDDPPEHRRGESPPSQQPGASQSGGGDNDDDNGGCNCI